MPHFPKPFFKEGRGVWHVEIDRKQQNLGPDKEAAFDRYYELMRAKPKPVDATMALGVVDAYFGWVKSNKGPRTVECYERHLRVFAKAIPSNLLVSDLKPFHVTQVLGRHPKWSTSTKHGFCRAVQRAFRWAEDEELIDRSPLSLIDIFPTIDNRPLSLLDPRGDRAFDARTPHTEEVHDAGGW